MQYIIQLHIGEQKNFMIDYKYKYFQIYYKCKRFSQTNVSYENCMAMPIVILYCLFMKYFIPFDIKT